MNDLEKYYKDFFNNRSDDLMAEFSRTEKIKEIRKRTDELQKSIIEILGEDRARLVLECEEVGSEELAKAVSEMYEQGFIDGMRFIRAVDVVVREV